MKMLMLINTTVTNRRKIMEEIRPYPGLLYSSDRFKDYINQVDRNLSFYLKNQHDTPHYAYLSWRMHGSGSYRKFKNLGEGFFVSSIILLEQCLYENRDRKADVVVFPILFNIDHAIELYLKAIIRCATENNIRINGRVNTHNIITLKNNLMNDLQSEDINLYNLACKDFDLLNSFIDYFFTETDDFTYSRYPVDTSNNNHFYVNAKDNIIIDMEILIKWVKALFFVLDRNFILFSEEIEKRIC